MFVGLRVGERLILTYYRKFYFIYASLSMKSQEAL